MDNLYVSMEMEGEVYMSCVQNAFVSGDSTKR